MDYLLKYIKGIENLQAPGQPSTFITICDGKKVYTSDGVLTDKKEIEDYINHTIAAIVLKGGISATGIHHGTFITNKSYPLVKEVESYDVDDFDFDYELLKYGQAVMVAVSNHFNEVEKDISLIMYCGESGSTVIQKFENLDKCKEELKAEMEYLEEVDALPEETGYQINAYICTDIDEDNEFNYIDTVDDYRLAEAIANEVAEGISDVYGRSYVEIINLQDEEVEQVTSSYCADKSFYDFNLEEFKKTYYSNK